MLGLSYSSVILHSHGLSEISQGVNGGHTFVAYFRVWEVALLDRAHWQEDGAIFNGNCSRFGRQRD